MDKFRAVAGTGGLLAVITIILFLAGIKSDIDRNCANTANLGAIVGGVIAVDNELGKPSNRGLRTTLFEGIHNLRCRPSNKGFSNDITRRVAE